MRNFMLTLTVGSAGGITLYAIWVLSQRYDPAVENVASSLGLIFLSLLTAALGVFINRKAKFHSSVRRAWLLIASASFSNAVAEGLWLYYDNYLGIDPFPSPADFFYLLFYPLMLAGILTFPFIPTKRDQRFLLGLDMSIVMIVGALFLWYFILAPLQNSDNGEGWLAQLVALAYPVADLIVLAGVISLIQRNLEAVGRVVLIFLSGSMLFTGLADVLFAILETYSISYEMPPLNVLWMVSSWAMMVAATWQATHPISASAGPEAFSPLLRRALLYAAPMLGMGLFFASAIQLFGYDLRLYGTLVGIFSLGALVLLRQYVVLRDNQRLYEEIKLTAVTDAVTGIYNRHFFNEAIWRDVTRAERYKRPLSLIMMDVDNFKAYNDTYGHLQGDITLREIATLLKEQFRSTDLVARFGGDEFVAVLPETETKEAHTVAEKIRQAVVYRFGSMGLGISIGIATLQSGMTVQSLLAEADRNLYRVKSHKRVKK